MKHLVFSSAILLVIASFCNAKTDNAPEPPAPSIIASESTIKTVRSTGSTSVPNSVGPAVQNSLSSSQDGPPKPSPPPHNNNNNNNVHQINNHPNIIYPNVQPTNRPSLPNHSHHQLQQYVRAFAAIPKPQEYNPQLSSIKSNEIQSTHGPFYSQLQGGGQLNRNNPQPNMVSANGGYILSMNTDNGQTLTSSGPTPVIMQYLPQSQPSAGIQYLQLIPTRPLIVPISPYISPLPAQSQPPIHHHRPPHHALHSQFQGPRLTGPPGQSSTPFTNYASGQSYLSAGQIYHQPPNQPPHSTAHYPIYQSSTGNYASASANAPVVSFFRPHTGIQLINAPVDMSLNTNEYIPIQGDSAYKMRRS